MVDDTPPQYFPSVGCPIGRDSCPGDGPDPIHNYMDGTDEYVLCSPADSCAAIFAYNLHVCYWEVKVLTHLQLLQDRIHSWSARPYAQHVQHIPQVNSFVQDPSLFLSSLL